MGVVTVIAKHSISLIGPGVMLLFPLYASMRAIERAIESPTEHDDHQWLTYWVLYSFITFFELSCWRILVWLPFWPYVKLVTCIWLVLPLFNGAANIYENFVRRYVKVDGYLPSNLNYGKDQKKALMMMNLDTRKSLERYIEKYGPDSLDHVIKEAEKEAKKRK